MEVEGEVHARLVAQLDLVVDGRRPERALLRLVGDEGASLQLRAVLHEEPLLRLAEPLPVASYEREDGVRPAPGHVLWISPSERRVRNLIKRRRTQSAEQKRARVGSVQLLLLRGEEFGQLLLFVFALVWGVRNQGGALRLLWLGVHQGVVTFFNLQLQVLPSSSIKKAGS